MTDINEFILNRLDKSEEKQEKRDEEIRSALSDVGDELSNQSKLLSEYNQSLREHMKRTRMLEDKVEPMHKEWADAKVVEKHKMKTWKKVMVGLGIAGAVVGLLTGIAQLFGLL